jgi:Protein of unknown function (DUF2637)
MSADKAIRASTAGVVLLLAAFAAVISYSNIYTLARDHGQAGTAARLLPLSVDGLILAASLVLLHKARRAVARAASIPSIPRAERLIECCNTVYRANVVFRITAR